MPRSFSWSFPLPTEASSLPGSQTVWKFLSEFPTEYCENNSCLQNNNMFIVPVSENENDLKCQWPVYTLGMYSNQAEALLHFILEQN